ncbi:hypothetical protein L7F22_044704 [Adiantum nelumboides]|nr:hypothetical protein [Adiantum nelumboides]
MLTLKTHIEVSKQSLQEALEAACNLEMEAQKKCSTIIGTHDWILSTIQKLQSEMLKTELQKEIDKMQQDIITMTNELQSAKRDHDRIAEKMRGSNESMLNTNCLADSLYAEGLRAIHSTPVEHLVCPISLIFSIEWCVFCGLDFGLQALYVVFTSCLHTYNVLCATHCFSHSQKYVAQSCNEIISYEWMAAMGLGPTTTQAIDGENDEAPIALDFEDFKELSMQELDSTEVEKEANIGGEEETRLHEQQERIRGDLIVAGFTPNEALKALTTRAKA